MKMTIPFTLKELACKCGCGLMIEDPGFISKLVCARKLSACRYVITSWCRCVSHNTAISGDPNSLHMLGMAVDISTISAIHRCKVVNGLLVAGFNRIFIYSKHIHADGSKIQQGQQMHLGHYKTMMTESKPINLI